MRRPGKKLIGILIASLFTICFAHGASAWWDSNYQYRKQITITNNSGGKVSVDTLVGFITDMESLINDSKLRSDGKDWRIVYDNGSTKTEIGQKIESGWNTSSSLKGCRRGELRKEKV